MTRLKKSISVDPLLTVEETAEILGVSPTMLRDNRTRPLAYVMVGRHLRFQLSDIRDYIEENKTTPPAAWPVPIGRRRRRSPAQIERGEAS